jgi:hypothetical protein
MATAGRSDDRQRGEPMAAYGEIPMAAVTPDRATISAARTTCPGQPDKASTVSRAAVPLTGHRSEATPTNTTPPPDTPEVD